METMNDVMMDAAKTAGISKERAEIIYSMKVLGRNQSDNEGLNLTSYESSWIVDIDETLRTSDPKAYHRLEKRKVAKEQIYKAILVLLGGDAIYETEIKLDALATELNKLMVESFDDTKLSLDDFAEIAEKIVKHAKAQSHEAVTGLEPPD